MEYAEIHDLLAQMNAVSDVAESHAVACGMLVANNAADKLLWIKQIMGALDEDAIPEADIIESLGDWFDEIKNNMQDSNLRFDLCLPDDDDTLAKRVAALQEWCRGFIFGVALSGLKDFGQLPEDTKELLSDFSRIGAEEEFDLDNSEESEASYADISQYIRVGVLLINEELQPMKMESAIH